MKWIFSLLLILILFSPLRMGYAQSRTSTPKQMTTAPRFFALGKVNGNDVLKMECDGQAPSFSNLNCEFTQVLITKKSQTELSEERKKRKLEYDKITVKDFNDAKVSFKKMRGEVTKERQALLDSMTPEKQSYSKKLTTMVESIDACKTKNDLIRILDEMDEFDNKCCNVRIYNWKDQFQRISHFKWILNPGPEGLCNVVRIRTLEANDDHYLLWKYSEVTVSVDVDKKRNDLGDKICGAIELNKPVVYSWDIPTDFIPECSCIKYSW